MTIYLGWKDTDRHLPLSRLITTSVDVVQTNTWPDGSDGRKKFYCSKIKIRMQYVKQKTVQHQINW